MFQKGAKEQIYLLKKTFGKADAIILLGHIFKEKYRKIGLESDNTFILPNPVDKIDDSINIEKSIAKLPRL